MATTLWLGGQDLTLGRFPSSWLKETSELLEKAGFSQVEVYAAIPSYNDPRFLIPLEGRQFRHYARSFGSSSNGSLVRRALKAALLMTNPLQHLTYSCWGSFAFCPKRRNTDSPWLSRERF